MVRSGLAAVIAFMVMAVAAPSSQAQVATWQCDAYGYLFQTRPSGEHLITRVDLATGENNPNFRTMTTSVNAVGFNVLDGFFYGMGFSNPAGTARELARVHPDGTVEGLGLPVDSLGVPMSGEPGYPTGDVDLNGHYWAMNTAVPEWYEVDLTTSPPSIIRRGTPIAAPGLGLPADWVFVGNELYGTTNVVGQPDAPAHLVRFNPVTGVFQDLGPTLGPDPQIGAAGAVFADAAGYLYSSVNATGNLYRIDPETRQTIQLPTGPTTSQNDGGRCQLAPIPTITLTKTVNGRVRAADQFTVGLANAAGTTLTSATTTGTNTTVSTTNWPVSQGQTYTITDAMAAGSSTPLGEYVKSIACTDSDGNAVAVGGSGPTWTLTVAATNYTCNVTNQAAADVVLEKTVTSSPIVPGENVTFSLKVTNNGPSTAVGETITDALPPTVTFSSASPGCSEAAGTVTCAAGDLAPGASRTFTITGRVASSLNECLRNTATASGSTPDPNTSNNSATICVPILGKSGVAMTKTASAPAAAAGGGQMMYTLVVRNNGPSDDPDVKVTDPLAVGLTLVSAEASQGSCTTANNRVSCDLGALKDGGSAQVLVTVNTTASPGCITNTARADGSRQDPDPSDNVASAQVCVPNLPPSPPPVFDLAVDKRASVSRPVIGQRVTYTIAVRNNGPGAAPEAKVTDTYNNRATVVSVRTTQGTCTDELPITCDLGRIESGATVTITMVITPLESGRQRNSASATSCCGTDGTPGNNIDTVGVNAQKVPLRITKVASSSSVRAGSTVNYRIRVSNPSKGVARNVRVCDRLPSGLSFVRSSPTARRSGSQRCWTISSLAARKSRSFRVTVRAARGASGNKVNRATVNSADVRPATARRPVRVVGGLAGVTG